MIDTKKIILKYYTENSPLFSSLWTHSYCVMQKALRCAELNRLNINLHFVAEAALLHDIGIFRCNAPDIFCVGELPYICHGIEGRKILDSEGLHRHALVCERHTGAGISNENITTQHLPLPLRDMLPISIEEQLVCYADKFFSKSGNLTEEKSVEHIVNQIQKFGDDSLQRFMIMHQLFAER